MKSKISSSASFISLSLLLFVLNTLMAQTGPSLNLMQERQNTIASYLHVPPYAKKEILSNWQQLGEPIMGDRSLGAIPGLPNSDATQFLHGLPQAERGFMPKPPETSGTLHFRGGGLRLDSSYVFVDWLGTETPFAKIFYYYDDEGRKTKEVYAQTEPYSQILFSYDDEGNLTTEEYQYLDWNGDWYGSKLISYFYSGPSLQPDTVITANWDHYEGAWVSWQKEIYTLNIQGILTEKSTFFKDEPMGFVLNKRTFYTYNNAAQLVEETEQRTCFQGNTDVWRNTGKTSFVYGASGELEEKATARWEVDHWRETERCILTYDDLGNLLREQFFYAKLTGDYFWAPTHQRDITFGPSGNNISVSDYEMGNQEWVISWQTDSLFNDEGDVIEVIEKSAFCTPLIVPLIKKVFLYNVKGYLIERLIYQWDFPTNDWKKWQRELTGYNVDKLLQSWVLQYENDDVPNEWEDVYQRLYSYDSLGLLKERIGQIWIDGSWIDDGLISYHYDSLSRPTEEVFHYWNGEIWKVYAKNSFEYDINGNLIEIMDWVWSFNGTWYWKQGNVRLTFEYDSLGREILEEVAFQFYKVGNWLPKYRFYTQYDPISGKPIGRNTEQFKQTSYNMEWYMTYQHFWNETSTPVRETADAGLDCQFANPYQLGGSFFCEGIDVGKSATLTIYDLLGRLQYQTKFKAGTQLNGQLSTGSYFLVITGNDGMLFRKKFVVQ